MKKTNRILFVIVATMLIAPSAFSFSFSAQAAPVAQAEDTLIFGTGNGPVDLDCVFAWDSASSDVYDQVIEGLYAYDLTDPSLAIKPVLATGDGTWSVDGLQYTVPLKTGVTFHDGTDFNADAVKWNFDRLAYFMNISGDLPEGDAIVQTESLYRFGDGTPIINHTVVNSDTSITFVLNRKFAALQALLCFGSSWVQSPTSTPEHEYVVTANGTIVGTGPYKYGNFTADVEVTFTKYDNYHNPAGAAKIPKLVYKIISDTPARMQAILNGDVHFLAAPQPEMLWTFYEDTWVNVTNPGPTLGTAYLGMNTKIIPVEVRQAISYAFDYDYCLEEIYNGYGFRMESPVPTGILMSDYTSKEATQNYTIAREWMQKAGYGEDKDVLNDRDWKGKDYLSLNYTYNTDNQVRADIYTLLEDCLGMIGIEVIDAGMVWADFIYRLYDIGGLSRDMLELFWVGWIPDYNDPSNYLDPLLSTSGGSNGAQYSNATMDAMLAEAMEETDPTARAALYSEIQRIFVEEEVPWVFGFTGDNWDAYRGVKGFPSNPMGKVYFAPVEFGNLDATLLAIPNEPESSVIPGYGVGAITIFSLAACLYIIKKRRN